MPAVTTLGQAHKAGWLISLRCARTREGLKSARACPLPVVLHVPTLVTALGHDAALANLQTVLRCPGWGSTRYEIRMWRPTGLVAADEVPKRRQMKLARSGRDVPNTLANCQDPVIVVACPCTGGRRAEYRKETLL